MKKFLILLIIAFIFGAGYVIPDTFQRGSGGYGNIAKILNPVGYEIRNEATLTTTTVNQQTVDWITLDDNSVYHAKAIVKAFEDGVNGASYEIVVTAKRDGGGAALIGGVTSIHTSESEAAWDATFTVDTNDLRVSVTGEAATTIVWTCTLIYSN